MKNKIIVLCAKACAGKDTVMKYLVDDVTFQGVVSHTTRPPRENEEHGVAYYFINEITFHQMDAVGDFVEHRAYNTNMGTWYYGVSKQELDDKLAKGNVVMILDKKGLEELLTTEYADKVVSFYISVDDDLRLQRYLSRQTITWDVVDECHRRFIADNKDFEGIEDVVDYIISNPDNSKDTYTTILRHVWHESKRI